MKKLMDSLMARQRQLIQNLEAPRQASPVAPEVLAERRAAEEQALESALEKLSTGDIHAAVSLLEPYAQSAQDTRTLTTLSRIRSGSGQFDEALELIQRAEALDPADLKVAFFFAELLQLMKRHQEAIPYRRRLAFTTRDGEAHALLALISTIVKAANGSSTLVPELRVAVAGLRKAPDLTGRHLTEAARLTYSIGALSAEAMAMHAEGDPCPANDVDATFSWTTMPAWCAAVSRVAERVAGEGQPGRRPSAVELGDVTIHPALQWAPILEHPTPGIMSSLAPGRIRARNEDPDSPLLMANAATAVLRLPRTPRRIDQPALLLGGNGSYYHDAIDFVSILAIAEGLGLDRRLPLVVNESPAKHMTELLDLLGYGATPLVPVGRNSPTRFARLMVTTRLAVGGQWFDPMLVRWYRRRLVDPLGGLPPPRRKLYLSRAGAERRRLSNEVAVVAALQPLGYEVVHAETMPVREQIALFAQASDIVGPAGSAFTNMIFAPPGARVVLLQNKQLVQAGGERVFDGLAASCGHQVATVECLPARLASGERSVDADLVADIDLLLSSLM